MRATRFSAGWLLSLILASAAAAQTAGERGGRQPSWTGAFDPARIFESMDANNDGVVTRDEQRGRREQERFDDYVRRAGVGDGRLTKDLFLKAFQQRMEERMRGRAFTIGNPRDLFRNYDRNNDGKLDREEIQRTSRLRGEVDRWDANHDQSIDQPEFEIFLQQLLGPSAASPTAPSPSTAGGNEAEKPAEPRVHYRAGKLPPNIQEWFKELDQDNDGQVGLYEWKGRAAEEFTRIDRNGDGFITIEEAEHALAHAPARAGEAVQPLVRIGGDR